MKILIASSEAVPFAKTGGLADVAGTLPKYFKEEGHEVFVFMPFYKPLIQENIDKLQLRSKLKHKGNINFKVTLGNAEMQSKAYIYEYMGISYVFVEKDEFFKRPDLYVERMTVNGIEKKADHPDNFERFVFFSKAVLEIALAMDIGPDVIHCHDWQTAMIPVFAKSALFKGRFRKIPVMILTIHNIAFQGIFPYSKWFLTSLDASYYSLDKMEYWGDINLLKGGIIYSDVITTVSNQYRRELQTKEYGAGLDGLLSMNHAKMYGILNGIDKEEWDPLKDEHLHPLNYGPGNTTNKTKFKLAFLSGELGLEDTENMLLSAVTRLTHQKGIDLLIDAFEELMTLPLNIVILGSGDVDYENKLIYFREKYPRRFAFRTGFQNELAHKIYAAGDFFIMPSRFEPCGLGQLIAMTYGNIPIVRRTGGLIDSVADWDAAKRTGEGIMFKHATAADLLAAVKTALSLYASMDFNTLRDNAMKKNVTWANSAKEYLKLYRTEGMMK